jgi:SHS2 domain-containing protein
MNDKNAGFREVDHTADLEIEVWGESLEALSRQAALGMNELLLIRWKEDQETLPVRQVTVEAIDEEGLLVSFLSELLYLLEEERLAGKRFAIAAEGGQLQAEVTCGRVKSYTRDIKAVTYHRLNIRRREGRLEANLVFDI